MQRSRVREWSLAVFIATLVGSSGQLCNAAEAPLNWDATKYFKYNIEDVKFDAKSGKVTVRFSVSDPTKSNTWWDIKQDPHFASNGARLAILIGWSTFEYSNIGSRNSLGTVPWGPPAPPASPSAPGAALPISINAATATVVPTAHANTYEVSKVLPLQAEFTGVVAMEGHPVWLVGTVWNNVPVKSAYQYFYITGPATVARREVVDINKCKVCHTGLTRRDGTVIPRLSLHGGNRTEELHVCVACHNPSQTDIVYRAAGDEESIDFKRMIHGIHAGKMRQNPLVIIGFQGAVNDFSSVNFPKELNDCTLCHIDNKKKGTFELPLAPTVQGSTVDTLSIPGPGGAVDLDPRNDFKITPIASACSACHDSDSAIKHMASPKSGGGFGIPGAAIAAGFAVEHCAECHGPGKQEDVRKAHEIGKQ